MENKKKLSKLILFVQCTEDNKSTKLETFPLNYKKFDYYFELRKKPKLLWNKLKQKPQGTLEFEMTEASKTLFSFDIPLNSEEEGKWISSLTSLKVYRRVFN